MINEVKLLEDTDIMTEQSPGANEGNCQYPGCSQPATAIAEDRRRNVVEYYCADHANQVIDQDSPEYRVCCPNCGCGFGVN